MNRPCPGERLLLVGDGDFSLSLSLCGHLKEAVITATSLDSLEKLSKDEETLSNINELKSKGVEVHHGIDATKLTEYGILKDQEFSRIIFNFPHVGGKSNLKKNRLLLKEFFCSAAQVVAADGTVMMTLCQGQGGTPADQPMREWHDSWQVVVMATYGGLILNEIVLFNIEDYPEYGSTGFRSQKKSFNTQGALTHIFTFPQPDQSLVLYNVNDIPDNSILICGDYIRDKLERDLLSQENHPLYHLRQQITTHLKHSFMDVCILSDKDLKPVIKKSDESASEECYTWTSGDQKYILRQHLLEHMADIMQQKEIKPDSIVVFSGPVCQRCLISPQESVVQHQLMGVFEKSKKDIKEDLVTFFQVLFHNNEFAVTIKASQSDTFQNNGENPCLQRVSVEDIRLICRGRGTCAIGEMSNFVFSRTELECTKTFTTFVLYLDAISLMLYEIPDRRLLWSCDKRAFGQFLVTKKFKVFSLFAPEYVHDMSFWENELKDFNEFDFFDVIRQHSGDFIKEVTLLDSYRCADTGRVSRCYRLVFQSCDQALSYHNSHRMQGKIRLAVAEHMRITLR